MYEDLKYRIKEHLDKLTKKEYTETLKRFRELGIKTPTLYSWIGIKENNKKSIPVDKFKTIADVLNLSIIDLLKS